MLMLCLTAAARDAHSSSGRTSNRRLQPNQETFTSPASGRMSHPLFRPPARSTRQRRHNGQDLDRDTPLCHRASQRAAMLGTRPARPIGASGRHEPRSTGRIHDGSGPGRTTSFASCLSRTSRNQKGDAAPRLCGQLWMIRRFTSARLFPQSAGAKQKNHSGSGHYGSRRVALRHFNRNGFFAESVKSPTESD